MFLAHGTTVVINALTERKGVRGPDHDRAGSATSLEIARGNRPDFFNLVLRQAGAVRAARPAREVAGPARADRGASARRSTSPGLAGDRRRLPRAGVEAVAICLLHAYANPAHEGAVLGGCGSSGRT